MFTFVNFCLVFFVILVSTAGRENSCLNARIKDLGPFRLRVDTAFIIVGIYLMLPNETRKNVLRILLY